MGNSSGGGGDSLEIQFNEIRSDLLKWIKNYGPNELIFPYDLSVIDYMDKMNAILQPQFVIINFDDSVISVNGEEKTCRGFIDNVDSKPHIHCNINRFNRTLLSDKYSLIHHEYAGLAEIEKNIGSASDYRISSQIVGFLKTEKTLKLEIKPNAIDRTKFVRLQRIDTVISTHKEKVLTLDGQLYPFLRVIGKGYANIPKTDYKISVTFINEEKKKQLIQKVVSEIGEPSEKDFQVAVKNTLRDIALDKLSCANVFTLDDEINCSEKVNPDPANILDEALENGFKRSWQGKN